MTVTPEPAAPAAVPAAVPAVPKRRNRLGLIGLLLVVLSFVAPIVVLIVAIIVIATDPNPPVGDNIGWAGIGAVVFMLFGYALASPIAVVGAVLGIVSLVRKEEAKAVAIIAIILGLPYGIIGLILLPAGLSLMGVGN